MSTAIAIGASTLQLPDPGESYSLSLINTNNTNIATEVNKLQKNDKVLIFTSGAFAWSSAYAPWDAGTLSVDASTIASSQMSSPQPAFAVPGSLSGSIKFTEPGIYSVIWWTGAGGNPGIAGYRIQTSGTWPGTPGQSEGMFGQETKSGDAYYYEQFVKAPFIRVPTANLEIRFTGNQQNSTTNTAKIRIMQMSKL